jgi:DNA modification methylase
VDLIITDPPYNVDYGEKNRALNKNLDGGRFSNPYDIKNDCMKSNEFYDFLNKVFTNLHCFISDKCPLYVFYGHVETLNFYHSIEDAGFCIKQMLVWVKEHFVIGRQDYQWKHEPIIYGWSKNGKPHYFCGERNHTTVIDNSEDLRKRSKPQLIALIKEMMNNTKSDVIYCNKPQASSEHPTMKPVKLFGELIQNSSIENDIVIDAFGGSGTTLMACEQLKRKARLIELDPVFCQVIIDRIRQFNPGIKIIKIKNIYEGSKKNEDSED